MTRVQPSMLPPLPDISEIHRRLQIIFPEGTPQRGYCIREMAARTIFVMLYIGAVEGSGLWMGPKHVYRMGDAQSRQRKDPQRQSYMTAVDKRGFVAPADRWFQDNTREPIRDETLRKGLVRVNAVVTRTGLAASSSKGRYALQADFAALLDPALKDEPLDAAIAAWQDRFLSAGTVARAGLIVPDQSPAPVCIEERAGKISRITDRDSSLGAPERDFNQWREPVFDHIQELLAGDFRTGTNHSRARERLVALAGLLTGDTLDVKERQFRIGYEIERLGRLVAAYRTDADDMPNLNAAVLEDLDHLYIALVMGIGKLERWSAFQRAAAADPLGEGDASPPEISAAVDDMASKMEAEVKYFDPELPRSFRFLAEATKDPVGVTKAIYMAR